MASEPDVPQSAREAAARCVRNGISSPMPAEIVRGEHDQWFLVQELAAAHQRGKSEAMAERDARIAELEAALRPLIAYAGGSWLDCVGPLIQRFEVAAAFDQDAVLNAVGSRALAQIMADMAKKLDFAVVALTAALKGTDHAG
jgi:hypothetical protein